MDTKRGKKTQSLLLRSTQSNGGRQPKNTTFMGVGEDNSSHLFSMDTTIVKIFYERQANKLLELMKKAI